MGLSGLEPPTSRLSGVRSNRLSYKPMVAPFACSLRPFGLARSFPWCFLWHLPLLPFAPHPDSLFRGRSTSFLISLPRVLAARPPGAGGDERVRTDDPLLAKQVLSQLSYTPIFSFGGPSLSSLEVPFLRTLKIKQRSNFQIRA